MSILAACVLLLSFASCDLVGEEPAPGRTEPPAPTADTNAPDETSEQTPDTGSSITPDNPADNTDTPGSPPADETPPETTAVQESAAPETPSATPEPTPDPTPEVTPPPASSSSQFDLEGAAILTETEDYGQEYIDKMIFLGDSTTYGMKYYAVLSEGKNTKQVWTPSNGTLTLSYQGFASIVYPEDGSEIPIRDAVEKSKPEYLVITLGVNGVSFMDEDYFKAEYKDLITDIQAISPDTKILCQSIFPVASNYEYLSSINNENISRANGWILEVAEETGTRFLNTASVLVGEDGWLPQEYQNGDGLHLNETSFTIVLSYIRTHGYQ